MLIQERLERTETKYILNDSLIERTETNLIQIRQRVNSLFVKNTSLVMTLKTYMG